jgi:hypothetical protein
LARRVRRAFEDDGVAERFELADVVTAAALGVDAGGVEPGYIVVHRVLRLAIVGC